MKNEFKSIKNNVLCEGSFEIDNTEGQYKIVENSDSPFCDVYVYWPLPKSLSSFEIVQLHMNMEATIREQFGGEYDIDQVIFVD